MTHADPDIIYRVDIYTLDCLNSSKSRRERIIHDCSITVTNYSAPNELMQNQIYRIEVTPKINLNISYINKTFGPAKGYQGWCIIYYYVLILVWLQFVEPAMDNNYTYASFLLPDEYVYFNKNDVKFYVGISEMVPEISVHLKSQVAINL